jgi:hypothetical protein
MEILAVSGVAITMMTPEHNGPVCATDVAVVELEELQFTLAEGPGRTAFDQQAPTIDTDLTRPQSRWPSFGAEALGHGVRAVFAYPLRIASTTFAVFTLYQRTAGPLTGAQDADRLVVTDVLAHALTAPASTAVEQMLAADQRFDRHRAVVHQAAGMLAIQLGVPVGDALTRLRAQALATHRPISRVAADLIGRPDAGEAL